jgi:hypothetical protein
MPSRRKKLTGKAMERRLAEGFGQGSGADYLPWLRTTDVPTRGTASNPYGWKHNRTYHLLSHKERNYFYCLEWQDAVIEIREQFPLMPVARTVRIAKLQGVRHPRDSDGPFMQTTDFLVTVQDGNRTFHAARAVKQEKELRNRRVLEKLELERRYWLEEGIEDWGIIVAEDIPDAIWRNVHWLHACRDSKKLNPISAEDIDRARNWLFTHFASSSAQKLATVSSLCDADLSLRSGTALKILRHLLARKELRCDIRNRIRTDVPLVLTVPEQSPRG